MTKQIKHISGSAGGYLVGRSHKQGGIKAINKATGQNLEMEGGEVVITEPGVSDPELREFDGKMMTNRQILSKINEDAGGVAFAEDGMEIPKEIFWADNSYATGGKLRKAGAIVRYIGKCSCENDKFEGGGEITQKVFRGIGSKVNATYGDISDAGMGTFYTDNKTMADWFSGTAEYNPDKDKYVKTRKKGETLESTITLKKAYIINGIDEDADAFQEYMRKIEAEGGAENYKKKLIAQGYDGIVLKNNTTNYYGDGTYNIYVVFEENKMPPEKPLQPIQLPADIWNLINLLDSGRQLEILNEWNKNGQDRTIASQNRVLPQLGKTIWKLILDAGNPFGINELGNDTSINFTGKELLQLINTAYNKIGFTVDENTNAADRAALSTSPSDYKNPYEINRAIERLLDGRDSDDFSPEEKEFIRLYSGYGGFEKFGATGKGILYEYFTPDLIVKKMWALAYKYGFGEQINPRIFEPSVGTGNFFKYAPEHATLDANEINPYSLRICKILYPKANVALQFFEQNFIPTDMIQLAGRIWRQGNEFLYIRIVNPLMIDSIDIFMFQKLEEKTARINSIWSNDGKSVLKIEEIDAAEIKFALIKDPAVIARIEVDEKKIRIQDDVNSSEKIKHRLGDYLEAKESVDNYTPKVNEEFEKYFPGKSAELPVQIRMLAKLYSEKYPKDSDGRVMANSWEVRDYWDKQKFETDHGQISPQPKPSSPYWFGTLVLKMRLIEKENRDLLKPRNIIPATIQDYVSDMDQKNIEKKEHIKYLESEDYVVSRTAEIIAYREANQIKEKTIQELVTEFATMNHLLSEKRIKNSPSAIEATFQRLNPDGTPKTDPETLAQLETIVTHLPQTKTLHTDINGVYLPERVELHRKIIAELKNNLSCSHSDDPIAILTGGSPASGKTSFLKKYAPYLLSDAIFHIDADEIRAMLPEYEGWNAATTHLETKDIVNTLLTDRKIGMPCKSDLIYDGTMNSTKNYLPLIGMLKSLGYKVFIIYMNNVKYGTVKERMISRYKKTGRFVPIEVIDDFFGKGKEALYELKSKVDGYMIIDASDRNYHVIEQGGMELPKDRVYSEMQSVRNIGTELIVDDISEVQSLTEAIEGLEVLRSMSSKNEKKELAEAIQGLKILLLMAETEVTA